MRRVRTLPAAVVIVAIGGLSIVGCNRAEPAPTAPVTGVEQTTATQQNQNDHFDRSDTSDDER
jgi:hypothetical protein